MPVPATVVITWVVASTIRIRLFTVSAINRFPAASTATLDGLYNFADVAAPLSPEKPIAPVPATVVMTDDWLRGEVLPRKFPLAANDAEMTLIPGGNAAFSVAVPFVTLPVPSTVLPLKKVTVPLVTVPPPLVTVAVKRSF